MTYQQRSRPACFTRLQLNVMYDFVHHTPLMSLDEVQKKTLDLTGTQVALATIHQDLHKQLGLSLVKTRWVHPLQSDTDRAKPGARPELARGFLLVTRTCPGLWHRVTEVYPNPNWPNLATELLTKVNQIISVRWRTYSITDLKQSSLPSHPSFFLLSALVMSFHTLLF